MRAALFLGSFSKGDRMKLILELESIKPGLLTLMNETQSHLHLDMSPASPSRPSRIVITSEQFNLLRYDIRAHATGTCGVKKDLLLFVIDSETGTREQLDFDDAAYLVDNEKVDDSEASELQAAADAAIEKARAERLAEKKAAQEAAGNGSLAAGVEQATAALVES